MVPWPTVIAIGSTGDKSVAPNAGVATTLATGAAVVVVVGLLELDAGGLDVEEPDVGAEPDEAGDDPVAVVAGPPFAVDVVPLLSVADNPPVVHPATSIVTSARSAATRAHDRRGETIGRTRDDRGRTTGSGTDCITNEPPHPHITGPASRRDRRACRNPRARQQFRG
jgi:hypothetical protein